MAGVSIFNSPLISDANLVNYYRLNGNANDYKGAANGSATGMSYSTSASPFGTSEQGGDFSANTAGSLTPSSYVQASFYSPGSNDFTYYYWCNLSTYPAATTQAPLYNEANGPTGSPHIEFAFDGTNLSIDVSNSGGSGVGITTSSTTFTTGTWYQIAYTRTGGTGTLYVNATSKGTVGDTITTISSSNGQIGRRLNTTYPSQYAFDGYIADVAMFSRALSSTEISNLYNNSFPVANNSGFFLAAMR